MPPKQRPTSERRRTRNGLVSTSRVPSPKRSALAESSRRSRSSGVSAALPIYLHPELCGHTPRVGHRGGERVHHEGGTCGYCPAKRLPWRLRRSWSSDKLPPPSTRPCRVRRLRIPFWCATAVSTRSGRSMLTRARLAGASVPSCSYGHERALVTKLSPQAFLICRRTGKPTATPEGSMLGPSRRSHGALQRGADGMLRQGLPTRRLRRAATPIRPAKLRAWAEMFAPLFAEPLELEGHLKNRGERPARRSMRLDPRTVSGMMDGL